MNDAAAAFIVVWVLCAFIGAMVGAPKGLSGAGFMLGLLLGVVGVIIVAVMQPAAGSQQQSRPGAWWPDPYGAHQLRYYDGRAWTVHVADGGERGFDPRPGLHD